MFLIYIVDDHFDLVKLDKNLIFDDLMKFYNMNKYQLVMIDISFLHND